MWCKLASPLGRRTQPLLSPASESSHPLRFRATQASTPDRDADCESCVAPDSPNLSIVQNMRNGNKQAKIQESTVKNLRLKSEKPRRIVRELSKSDKLGELERKSVQRVGTCSGGNTGGRLVQGVLAKCAGLR